MHPQFQEFDIGHLYNDGVVQVFFGNCLGSVERIASHFPALNFKTIKQTHSDIVVEASSVAEIADAHWTETSKTGLLVSTADCIPVMIYNRRTKQIAAVHAGWKGVANQIVFKTLLQLSTKESTSKDFLIWTGPHIQQLSFEVKKDVLDFILAASFGDNKNQHWISSDGKIFVNLLSILHTQMKAAVGSGFKLFELNSDTLLNPNYFSFRRDKTVGRNKSFITLV